MGLLWVDCVLGCLLLLVSCIGWVVLFIDLGVWGLVSGCVGVVFVVVCLVVFLFIVWVFLFCLVVWCWGWLVCGLGWEGLVLVLVVFGVYGLY